MEHVNFKVRLSNFLKSYNVVINANINADSGESHISIMRDEECILNTLSSTLDEKEIMTSIKRDWLISKVKMFTDLFPKGRFNLKHCIKDDQYRIEVCSTIYHYEKAFKILQPNIESDFRRLFPDSEFYISCEYIGNQDIDSIYLLEGKEYDNNKR